MGTQITDISGDFLSFWEQAQNLDRFPTVVDAIRRARTGLEERIDGGLTRAAKLFDLPRAEFAYITMVGTFCSNGWAWEYRGRVASFIALEYINDPVYLDSLVAHEAAHAFQAQASGLPWKIEVIGQGLFMEGFATLASALLVPGLSAEEYLWMGLPGWSKWVTECEQRTPELARHLLADLDQESSQLYNTYFMVAKNDLGLPIRSGYFIGYKALQALHQRYSMAEMARWSPERAVAELAAVLTALAASPGTTAS